MVSMIVTAWNNGHHCASGAGYGLKLSAADRDEHFKRQWKTVSLQFPDVAQPVRINIDKHSFWNSSCRELISRDIGQWLLESGLAPWPRGRPPKVTLHVTGEAAFKVQIARASLSP
ncbi:MAG TPA: hypothetical protein VHU23_12420 [Rhizomicrobium sp.]|jgi:hypothetical protein|nr:hypothetical protein [Rhizomicrobium sp.]